MSTRWGIDLGGTKIECVVLPESPSTASVSAPLWRGRISTEAQNGYSHVCTQIKKLIDQAAAELGHHPAALGIGHPGTLDPLAGLLKNSNTTCLNGMPLKSDLQSLLKLPVTMANDANCFALAEASFGAGTGAAVVFGVILGTGVGGGIVVNGKVLAGHQGIAGEWGHNILLPDGPECYCGKRGCVEAMISGPALERVYQKLTGTRRAFDEIAERAARGDDPAAVQTAQQLTSLFGRAIAVVINILDPDCIVLGGGVSNFPALYTDGFNAARSFVFNNRLETRIVQHKLGDSAGVFGAAMLMA